MRLLYFFFFISIFSYSEVLFSDVIEKKVKKTISKKFSINSFNYTMINSIPELGIKDNHIYKIINEGEVVGYFALDQSFGQYDYFDYLVLFGFFKILIAII